MGTLDVGDMEIHLKYTQEDGMKLRLIGKDEEVGVTLPELLTDLQKLTEGRVK